MSQNDKNLNQKREMLKELLNKLGNTKKKDIAIIGISGHYPGAKDIDELWNEVRAGQSSITKINRWNNDRFMEDGSVYTEYGGFIEDVDKFDPLFFNIPPSEAKKMDPQERLLLETVWETFEDAGYSKNGLDKIDPQTGVFIGAMNGDYEFIGGAEWSKSGKVEANSSFWTLSNRISYFFNLTGPSMTIDTACSSALTALYVACASIQKGDCNAAVVGGCNLILHPAHYIRLCQMGMLSKKDYCSPFGEGADGFVAGEGIGTILLKSLEKAKEDGDNIYGVIKGIGVNAGGKTRGYTVPSPNLQAQIIEKVLRDAKIDVNSINYIETHGTGTSLGDPIEIAGLEKAFRAFTTKRNFCAVGSVKSNIGHLESASGMASIAKVLLQFQNKKLAPTIHAEKENPSIIFSETPFYVQKTLEDWIQVSYQTEDGEKKYPRRAGVSAFGAGGSNAFVLLEEYEMPKKYAAQAENEENVFLLSAKDQNRLKEHAKNLYDFVEKQKSSDFNDIIYTLQTGREYMEYKIALVVKSREDLLYKLSSFIQDENSALVRKEKTSHHFTEDRKEEIEEAFSQNDLRKLADLWLRGAKINWRRLYSVLPKKIALPFYPFAKERYWVEETKESQVQLSFSKPNVQDIYYYSTFFTEKAANEEQNSVLSKVLVLANRKDKLRSWMDSKQNIVVWNNGQFSRAGENEFTMNFQDAADYKKLLNVIDNEGRLPNGLVCIFDSEVEQRDFVGKIDILYYFLHELQEHTDSLKRIVLSNTKLCEEDEMLNCLAGYAKPLQILMPEVNVTSIQISGTVHEKDVYSILYRELHQTGKNVFDQVKVIEGIRYVLENKELVIENKDNRAALRTGTYLITGGLGAIGRIVAEHLLKEESIQIALLGRSTLDRKKQELLGDLGYSHKVAYYQADVSNEDSLVQAIQEIERKQGQITGVIHAAGVPGNHVLFDAEIEEFHDTLIPKIEGTLLLDKVLQNNPIQEFIVFSSTSAIIGDFGQCSYAVANRFMDHFVNYRNGLAQANQRKGFAYSMQWPLWKDGAMHLNKSAEKFYLESSEMEHLTSESGLKAFDEIAGNEHSTVAVFAGNKEKIDSLLAIKKEDVCEISKDDKVQFIIEYLKKTAAQIIDLDPDKIDYNESLGEYGYDSIYLKELVNKINNEIHIHLNATVFFSYSTIQELADYILDKYADKITKIIEGKQERKEAVSKPEKKTAYVVQEQNRVEEDDDRTVAIIGMSGMFPDSKDLKEFWKHLLEGSNMIHSIPSSRWAEQKSEQGKTKNCWGGLVPDVDKFDAAFFNISPIEADMMDPQQRLLLQVVWATIEDAGYKASDLSGTMTGVYLGTQFHDYAELASRNKELLAQATTGNATSLVANRISYFFNFHGPSESIDTACSSSLVAVHQAIRAIQCGDCETALAGGVSLMLSPDSMEGAASLGVLASDGKCKTFDKSADGYVKGEGIGAIYLKSLKQAKKDGDHIYCVIKGSAVNHGGRANSLTAPNAKAQAELLAKAWTSANIAPDTLSLLELHGTGTVLGDPVEVNGIREAYRLSAKKIGLSNTDDKRICLGAVKTNIGHLEPAAGIAGLIKVVLCMKNQRMLAVQNVNELNPLLDLEGDLFEIPLENKVWKQKIDQKGNKIPRRAGISAFGFGGTNCHVVVEEYREEPKVYSDKIQYRLICLSAKDEERLTEAVKNIRQELEEANENKGLLDISYTLLAGREEMESRLAILCASKEELKDELDKYLVGIESKYRYFGEVSKSEQKLKKKQVNSVSNPLDVKCMLEVAKKWVSGESIELKTLFANETTKRISLPTYSFEKELHWFEERDWSDTTQESELLAEEKPENSNLRDMLGNRIFTPEWREVKTDGEEAIEISNETMLAIGVEDDQIQSLREEGITVYALNIQGLRAEEIVTKIRQYNIDRIIWKSAEEDNITSDKAKRFDKILEQQEKGCLELFRLFKALVILGYEEKTLHWTIITSMAQAVEKSEIANPSQAAIHGLVGSAAKEYQKWSFALFDLGQEKPDSFVNVIRKHADRYGNALCWRHGKWYKQVLTESEKTRTVSSVYRDNGVYIVIGGAGEVGFIWSKYMICNYDAQIIWFGRKEENEKIAAQLDELERCGRRPVYISCNAADGEALALAYQQIKQRFGKIHGIIHSAVQIDNRSISRIEEDSFRQAVSVKVGVCVQIAKVFQNEELDFYMFFSSVNSFLKARKQSSYSTGLAFKDAFASYLSHFVSAKVKVMNWGYWDLTGNKQEAEKLHAWMRQVGIAPLESDRAMQYLEMLLSGKQDQILYLNTTKPSGFEGLKPIGLPKTEQKNSVRVVIPEVSAERGPKEQTSDADAIIDKLTDILAKVLRMKREKIKKEEAFAEYGLDSLLGVNYVKAVNEQYGIDLEATCIYDFSSIKQLATYIANNYQVGAEREIQLEQPKNVQQQWKEEVVETVVHQDVKSSTQGIAVIGISGQFPDAENVNDFWDNLANGRDCVHELPKEYLDQEKYYSPTKEAGKTYCKWGGVIRKKKCFDPMFFRISPKEAKSMSPHQRLVLEESWKAMEDSGHSPREFAGKQVGVYVGAEPTGYFYKSFTGYSDAIIASRLSYYLDLKGPALVVNTGCSSSAVAVHLACESLKSGESDMVVAGGVCASLDTKTLVSMSEMEMVSKSGKCHTFDEAADGAVFSEGIGMVVLKRLEDAIRDEDHIYGVIRASGMNQDGTSNGITAPNGSAQEELIKTTYEKNHIQPSDISYIEAHGTGTKLGDPIEVKALSRVFEKDMQANCYIGSCKSNIGHTGAASGVIGLIRILKAMENHMITKQLHYHHRNPLISMCDNLKISCENMEWKAPEGKKLMAALNSFGHSGTNVHMVVEEYQEPVIQKRKKERDIILPLSARNRHSLEQYVSDVKEFLEDMLDVDVPVPEREQENEKAEEKIISILAEVLDMESSFIDKKSSFDEYGMDSSQWNSLIQRVEELYQIELKELRRSSLTCINEIALFVSSKMSKKNTKKHAIRPNDLASLQDIAYTFQTGREAMEERVAFIGHDYNEICQEMKQFLGGEQDIWNCYYGTENDRKGLELFFDDEECNQIVSSWLQKEKADKLARYWTCGGHVQWSQLYHETMKKKSGLPTYPFREQEFWGEIESEITTVQDDIDAFASTENAISKPQVESVLLVPIWKEKQLNSDKKQNQKKENDLIFVCGIFTGEQSELREHCKELHLIEKDINEEFQYVAYEQLVNGILQAVKGRFEKEMNQPVSVRIIVSDAEPYNCCKGLLSALKTLAKEMQQFAYQIMLADDRTSYQQIVKYLEIEDMSDEAVSYINQTRRVLTWEEKVRYDMNHLHKTASSVWKDGSVYLITGGMGGIGYIFAKEIAKNTKDTVLVLTGRSKVNDNIREKLDSLRALGTKAYYYTCNIGIWADVNELVKHIIEEHGKLDGILHSAGVNRDSMFLNKNLDEVEQVLLPKVKGTEYLDQATKDIPLSFFIMFASGSGVVGNAGQFDYAAANAFMDEFSFLRNKLVKEGKRQGRTFSIDWPLWENGGMQVSDVQKEMMKEMLGMCTLYEEDGKEAFYRAYSMDGYQFFMQTGYVETIYENLFGHRDEEAVEQDESIDVQEIVSDGERMDCAVKYIRGLIAESLLIPEEELDIQKELSTYGVDSIVVMELNDQLEKEYPEVSKTLFFQYKTIWSIAEHIAKSEWFSKGKQTRKAVKKQHVEIQCAPQAKKEEKNDRQDIAIIGLSGDFPQSENYYEFWDNIARGKNLVEKVSDERWDVARYYLEDGKKEFVSGKTRCCFGGFIKDFDTFDNTFFDIKDEEVFVLDPQERLALETTWSCLEDAGYNPLEYEKQTGVFSGVSSSEYQKLTEISNHLYMLNCRIAYYYDFQGPSITTDSGCSSTLTAIHLACQSLQKGECKSALVVGANMILHPNHYTSISNMLSNTKEPRSCPFGTDDGYIPAECVGALLLKPLNDAERDGDHIYGVIKATHILQEGKTSWFGASNPNQQAKLMIQNFEKAGISPETIGCIEAASNGTRLGDVMEIDGLKEAFRNFTDKRDFCAIGSVKSYTGHAEAASTMLQVAKMLLQFKTEKFYPNLHMEFINSDIKLKDSPFYFMTKEEKWNPVINKADGTVIPRRGAISSFGTGGTMGHMILEEYKLNGAKQESLDSYVMLISADSITQLNEVVKRYYKFFTEHMAMYPNGKEEYSLMNIMYTLAVGRKHGKERVAFYVKNEKEFIGMMDAYLRNQKKEGIITKNSKITGIHEDRIWEFTQKWLSGQVIEFASFFKGMGARRVSLPTYVFSKKRFPLGTTHKKVCDTVERTKEVLPVQENVKNRTVEVTSPGEEVVLSIMSKIFGIREEELDIDKEFQYYGMDSEKVIQATYELEKMYGSVPKTIFFRLHTVRELMEHFNGQRSRTTQDDELSEISKAIMKDDISIEDALEQIIGRRVDGV